MGGHREVTLTCRPNLHRTMKIGSPESFSTDLKFKFGMVRVPQLPATLQRMAIISSIQMSRRFEASPCGKRPVCKHFRIAIFLKDQEEPNFVKWATLSHR